MSLEWRRGKRALRTSHRNLVSDDAARSIDLDAELSDEHPNAARWDYILEARTRSHRRGSGIEVHSGNVGQVELMIEKKQWAAQVLAEREPDLAVGRWHWVVPPNATFQFPATGTHARRLAQAGVERPSRHITRGDLFR